MNHGMKLHQDGTLEITMPKGVKIGRVLVCEAGTQNGSLYYPEESTVAENATVQDDLISRQDAIDALDEQIRQCDKALSAFDISLKDEYAVKVERASLVAFRETLEYMPSAEPERKKGKWINNSPVTMKCDQCGYVIKDWRWNELNFCANCGADMRGKQDED